ncbi:NAD-dependent protein deacetylase [Massilia sp. GCM10020059]|uniref:protein acetyllysine N-acetyltransferase n=1 Tax=Massilia agrisoli TaxID=2892444 RepID=A0ABS8IQG6_9BURK|nr:NAD-dependent protein deacetylase [Massilia agrisoli]MCC6070867.1 NAD-dependent protein deacetylase [Massilia agrisoli]
MDHDTLAVQRLAQFLTRHSRVLVLTGAGISTGSGIPDYRDKDGSRRGPTPVQGPDFRRFEATRRRYWARSMVGYPTLARAEPNAGHRALADLAAQGAVGSLMTQNVDGLHQRAGSSDVLELHGNIHSVVCLDCHARFSRAFVQSLLEEANPGMLGTTARPLPDGDAQLEPETLAAFHEPFCVHCSGTLKPDVVFFGDGVPADCTRRALARMEDADALLVVGSSLVVFSGYRFCRMAAAAGKPIAAVNLGKTRADDLLSLKLEASAEQVLPLLRNFLN